MNTRRLLNRLSELVWPWTVATLVAAILGSIIQTQFNLAAIESLGMPVPLLVRLDATLHDLANFMPFYAVVVGTAFLFALPVALIVGMFWPRSRFPLLVAAGVVGLAVGIEFGDVTSPMPTVLAATRVWTGYLAMLGTGAAGALVFALMTGSRLPAADGRLSKFKLFAPVAVLAVLFTMYLVRTPEQTQPDRDISADEYEVEVVVEGLAYPWGMAFLPDGDILVTERPGRLRLIRSGSLVEAPIEGVPEVYAGDDAQGGLMDVELSPHFERDRQVYLSYACGDGQASTLCVGRGKLEAHALIGFESLFVARPLRWTGTQYGGRMEFLPDDTLIVSVGDGFEFREQPQVLDNHLGKVLRMTMEGRPAEDDPVPGADPYIYSFGHRNPQGLAFDEPTGRLFEAEHGPMGGDEVNLVFAGKNYGWPLATHGVNYPGDLISPYTGLEGLQGPLYNWTPSEGISDVVVYRGEEFPEFDGDLLVAALAGTAIHRLRMEGDEVVAAERMLHEMGQRIRQISVAVDGTLYVLTDHDPGKMLRIFAAGGSGEGDAPQG